MRCNCENERCQSTEHIVGDHDFTQCPRTATIAVDFIGGICGTCAKDMPAQYLHGALTDDWLEQATDHEPTDNELTRYDTELAETEDTTWQE